MLSDYSVIMLSFCYAESRYAECHYPVCRYAECHFPDCRYAECCYAYCHLFKYLVFQIIHRK
jgi:hypothetical protein